MNEGKIPTTPTSSAIIAGVQVQEMLKLLHADRNLPTLAGKCYVFNGLTHDSYVVEYQRKPDCMSHDTYENIIEKPWSVSDKTLGEALEEIRSEMGENAVIELGRDIVTTATCSCGCKKDIFMPVHKLRGHDIICPECSNAMSFDTIHAINGTEDFLDKTAGQIGVPPLDIVGGRVGMEMNYYEFSADEQSVFEGL